MNSLACRFRMISIDQQFLRIEMYLRSGVIHQHQQVANKRYLINFVQTATFSKMAIEENHIFWTSRICFIICFKA